MIVSFSVSNFRSFSSEETLSLVASKRLAGPHEDHEAAISDSTEKVLRTAVIYGANGAGKSNLFKALRYAKSVALEPRSKNAGTGRESFRFSDEANQTSNFDLHFLVNGNLYRFGFKVDDQHITEEWLVRVFGTKEKILYERITDASGKPKVEAEYLRSVGDTLMALTKVGGPPNQSFLATVYANLSKTDIGQELGDIINWFRKLTLIAPEESFGTLGHTLTKDPTFLEFAGNFLQASSTGVDHLEAIKEEISEDKLRGLLPQPLASSLIEELVDSKDGRALFLLGEGNELLIERSDQNHYYRISIQAAHEHHPGKVIPLELGEESDGTRRLLNLLPALHLLKTRSGVFVIDEIDRSMHPELVWKFLEFFLKSCEGGQGQLIVTTHESNLLDLDLLRRDEIWFVEKDQNGATRLYSMADFKVRKDLEIRKGYLQGRFGAVPFLGNLDRLLEERA